MLATRLKKKTSTTVTGNFTAGTITVPAIIDDCVYIVNTIKTICNRRVPTAPDIRFICTETSHVNLITSQRISYK